MTTDLLLTYLSRLNKIFMHSVLIIGKMAKSGILNYYGADKYAKQNNINGKNEIIFESLNTLAGFITTYSLSLSSGQKQLNKLLNTPSSQLNNFKNTIKTFPILSILIMFRSLSDVSTDSMIANPILEDAFQHVNKVIPVNIKLTALSFTISFGIIGLFCDIAFNAPAELRLLQKISTIIKKKLGIPTSSLEFTQIEQDCIKKLLKDPIFNINELDQEYDDSDEAPCLISPNEKLIQILCQPDIQKTMESLLKCPELLKYCKKELSEEDALLILDKLTTLTFNYASCTTFNAHLIRAAVILPTIHLVFIKNMELTAITATHIGASPKISQNIAYSLGSFIFLLKFISMNGKPVEYLKTTLNQPLSILVKDCLNTIKNHPVSLFIGILANAPYIFFSLAQIKEVAPNPYIYYPLSTIFMLAQTITAATFLVPRIIDRFQCCDALCNDQKETVLLQDIGYRLYSSTSSCSTESAHAHLILDNHQIETVNLKIDLPSSIPITVPQPIKTPNHSLDNVLRMSSPRNHPYHIRQNDSENYSIT